MIGWPTGMAIHLAVAPVDFRKAFDGLCIEIVEVLERDPLSGELFVFRNRAGDKLKALYWDGQGFVMIYKRLRVTPLIQPSCQPQQRFRGNLEKYVLLSHDTDQG
ncbi:IS66 family insertion sequence element accessory protein TnpB [Ectothiorhodospira shaposhnikovii]|uniref:IS66 family insertion sequence element accessory protein TnpB n=1 Tax=Ectothiorhodospira shaposhnikovii TaxID=1054 RepID=UPI001EE91CBC|nr:IS66 family insertion sequence element accessory protein TnpB [Ectothiorhodospira shaposhnikovii]MCG5513935.1 IS66 family insertion sequence element accessory protein TnpB [Ectothiorhodospira shaposhnikovii]